MFHCTSKGWLKIILVHCDYSIEIFKTDVVKCTGWNKITWNKNILKTETQYDKETYSKMKSQQCNQETKAY